MGCDGVEGMNAGTYIGRRVSGIQVPHQIREEILPWKLIRTQILTIGPYAVDDEAYGHSDEKKRRVSIVLFPRRGKKEVQHGDRDIEKPQQVGDDKEFVKRNPVIQPYVNAVILCCHCVF